MFRLSLLLFLAFCLHAASGHGRLATPPSRSSAWRYGFDTPPNYTDHELFCGGFSHQWDKNGGKCGICGDPWDGARENEAGGRYATGTIVGEYKQGQVIDVTVELTANHMGYFEFRLCPHNNIHVPAKQECFDQYLLQLADGSGTRLPIYQGMFLTKLKLRLPAGVTCSQCILQWRYNTGNRWGYDPATGDYGLGLGPQEQFYGCADVSIHGQGTQTTKKPSTTTTKPVRTTTTKPVKTTTTKPLKTTTRPVKTTTPRPTKPTTRTTPKPVKTTTRKPLACKGVNTILPGIDKWCTDNCQAGYCPPDQCVCEW